jgi:L-amino acid N-acyltransferase YncA
MVRHADPDRDGAACAAIYAQAVLGGHASYEEIAPDADEIAARIASASSTHAWLVHEAGGEVTGYAYAGPHHARSAYRWAAAVAVYVSADHHGRGIGRELYGALLGLLERQGLRWATAGISLPNPASVALHEALGFQRVASYPSIGFKLGAWRDVGWWQLELGGPWSGAPAEPLGPQRL